MEKNGACTHGYAGVEDEQESVHDCHCPVLASWGAGSPAPSARHLDS